MKEKIDDVSIEQVIERLAGICNDLNPYTVGDTWFIQTVTHYFEGEIKFVGKNEIVLKGGTVLWIAGTGRFTDFFKGMVDETEICGEEDFVINRGSIVCATRKTKKLNIEQK